MKIDVTKIDGFEEMDAEAKLQALMDYEVEVEEPDYSDYVKKSVFDKTASELAAKKKELKSHMSEDEQLKAQQQEEMANLTKQYNELLHENQVAKNKSQFLGLGYDEKLAEDTAKALADGNLDKVFENQKTYLTAYAQQIKSDVLKQTPKPTTGGVDEVTREKLDSMSDRERYEFAMKHPEEYQAFYKKG